MNRLKLSQVKGYRDKLIDEQYGCCSICKKLLSCGTMVPNLDHNHKTGMIRGVLCRPCNTLLGKIENFANSYGHPNLEDFLFNVWDYISMHRQMPSDVYHYTYKTEEEKRLQRNAKARKARASKKGK